MPPFSTKLASIADIPAIISIQEKTWEPTYREILSREQIDYMFREIYSPQALEKQMTEGQEFLMLLDRDVQAGFSSVAPDGPGRFKLHKIYVLPSTQGTGAGKFLLSETESYVRQLGGNVLALNVNRYNKARFFYEKLGFEVVAEKDIAIGPYWMNDYILEKQLN